jgi:hypothetical protein
VGWPSWLAGQAGWRTESTQQLQECGGQEKHAEEKKGEPKEVEKPAESAGSSRSEIAKSATEGSGYEAGDSRGEIAESATEGSGYKAGDGRSEIAESATGRSSSEAEQQSGESGQETWQQEVRREPESPGRRKGRRGPAAQARSTLRLVEYERRRSEEEGLPATPLMREFDQCGATPSRSPAGRRGGDSGLGTTPARRQDRVARRELGPVLADAAEGRGGGGGGGREQVWAEKARGSAAATKTPPAGGGIVCESQNFTHQCSQKVGEGIGAQQCGETEQGWEGKARESGQLLRLLVDLVQRVLPTVM